MKKGFKNLIMFLSFWIMFLLLYIFCTTVVTPKWLNKYLLGTYTTVKGFYKEEKNSLDVLFIGDSSMYRTISPMELYRDYGIISYDYAIPSSRPYTTYYLLKDALKYQKPKIVVLDTITFYYNSLIKEEYFRKVIEYLPFSETKIEMMNNPLFNLSFDDKLSLYLPSIKYHTRWEDLDRADVRIFYRELPYYTKGFMINNGIEGSKKKNTYMIKTDKTKKMMDYTEEYVNKIIELCNDNGIKLIFLAPPETKVWDYASYASLDNWSKEKNIPYYDMNALDIGIDLDIHSGDGGEHLNIFGSNIATKNFGKYLKDNYDLIDHRGNKKWDKDLEKYDKLVEEEIKEMRDCYGDEKMSKYENSDKKDKRIDKKSRTRNN